MTIIKIKIFLKKLFFKNLILKIVNGKYPHKT